MYSVLHIIQILEVWDGELLTLNYMLTMLHLCIRLIDPEPHKDNVLTLCVAPPPLPFRMGAFPPTQS